MLLLQDGFYDLSAGCRPCECNQGGSTSQTCDQDSPNAQCPCLPNVELTTCRIPAVGYFSKALDEIIFEAEEAILEGVCCKIVIVICSVNTEVYCRVQPCLFHYLEVQDLSLGEDLSL